jgi:hypothetical protein
MYKITNENVATVKPVLRGHLWNKEKLTLPLSFQPSHSKLWSVAAGSSQMSYERKTIAIVVEYMFCDCPKGGLSLSFIVIVKPAVTSIKQSFF